MILRIELFKSNRGTLYHNVYYKNFKRRFDQNQCLPKTVIEFLMSSNNVESITTQTGTISIFR